MGFAWFDRKLQEVFLPTMHRKAVQTPTNQGKRGSRYRETHATQTARWSTHASTWTHLPRAAALHGPTYSCTGLQQQSLPHIESGPERAFAMDLVFPVWRYCYPKLSSHSLEDILLSSPRSDTCFIGGKTFHFDCAARLLVRRLFFRNTDIHGLVKTQSTKMMAKLGSPR